MKRLLALLAAAALAVSLAACSPSGPVEPVGPQEPVYHDFSGYCIEFTYPDGWELYSVEEPTSLVDAAVLAVNADETIAIKMYCGRSGATAFVVSSQGEDAAQLISEIRGTLDATVTPQATYNNLQNGVITVEELIRAGSVLPRYTGELINQSVEGIEDLARVSGKDDGTLAAVQDPQTGLWGYINKLGEYVITPRFIEALDFSEGYAAVRSGTTESSTWGYITRTGAFAPGLEPRFNYAGPFSQGLAVVSDGENGLFYVNSDGSVAVTAFGLEVESSIDLTANGFANASNFRNNYALVAIYDISSVAVAYLIDINGRVCFKVGSDLGAESFDSSFSLSADRHVLYKTSVGFYGAKDDLGITVIPEIYNDMQPYSSGLIVAALSSRYGYIDFSGEAVLPFRYEAATEMSEYGAFVLSSGLWGIINPDGTSKQPPAYEDVVAYVDGVASVKQNGLWALMDSGGSLITPYIFSSGLEYTNGAAWFEYNGLVGAINTAGEVFIEPEYSAARSFN